MSVHALALSADHEFTKTIVPHFTLLTGLGVEGDCHSGVCKSYIQPLSIPTSIPYKDSLFPPLPAHPSHPHAS
jgi:hypothetical protein